MGVREERRKYNQAERAAVREPVAKACAFEWPPIKTATPAAERERIVEEMVPVVGARIEFAEALIPLVREREASRRSD